MPIRYYQAKAIYDLRWDKKHKGIISDINDLQSTLNSKAEFLHNHDEKYPTIEYLEEKKSKVSV